MYEAHFGLRVNPFSSSPTPEFVYESREHREALAHFQYAVANREAFVLLTGEVGTGKTTAVQALRRQLPPGTPVAVVTHTTLQPRELLDEIALRFGLEPRPDESKPMLVRRLESFLEDHRRQGGQALLILDEAHLLDPSLLEEVRLLSNLESDLGGKLVQICLVGQPELESHLQQPELRQLRQRISVRYALNPLSREETRGYIRHRLGTAGASDPAAIFPDDACDAVHALSQGIPREINVLAGQALLNAFLEEAPAVTRAHVFSARTDYGFQGIVTGAAALTPEPGPAPPTSGMPPRRGPAPPIPAAADPPREPAAPSRPIPPPPPPARPAGDPPPPRRRPIPLPPASLRPPPRTRPRASRPEPAAVPEREPARGRLAPGPGTAPAYGGRARRGRGMWVLLVVILVAVLAAAAFWLRGGGLRPAEEVAVDMPVTGTTESGTAPDREARGGPATASPEAGMRTPAAENPGAPDPATTGAGDTVPAAPEPAAASGSPPSGPGPERNPAPVGPRARPPAPAGRRSRPGTGPPPAKGPPSPQRGERPNREPWLRWSGARGIRSSSPSRWPRSRPGAGRRR